MDAREKRVYDLAVASFKDKGVQVIKVDQPTSKVYNLITRKFAGLGTVQQEIKEFIESSKEADVVFIYTVDSIQIINDKSGMVEWAFSIRMDLQ